MAAAQNLLFHSVSLPLNFEYNNVFNDLSFQWFDTTKQLPQIAFQHCEIEKEHFEINQDDIDAGDPEMSQLESQTGALKLQGDEG